MSRYSGIVERQETSQEVLSCLSAHVHAGMHEGSFVTIIHAGNSDYIRVLHLLISRLLMEKRRVNIFDYHRRIKTVYLQQLLNQQKVDVKKIQQNLNLRVILDENHALDELVRLQRRTPSKRRPPAFFVVDPSGLFGRLRGGVKQTAEGLHFQYDAAKIFAQKGYAVLVSDFGGRQFHRIESVVPAQLKEFSTMVLQFLPQRIKLHSC